MATTKIETDGPNFRVIVYSSPGANGWNVGVQFSTFAHAQRVADAIEDKPVHIVIWQDGDDLNAQAYVTREAAIRDFPEFDDGDLHTKTLVESTVQG